MAQKTAEQVFADKVWYFISSQADKDGNGEVTQLEMGSTNISAPTELDGKIISEAVSNILLLRKEQKKNISAPLTKADFEELAKVHMTSVKELQDHITLLETAAAKPGAEKLIPPAEAQAAFKNLREKIGKINTTPDEFLTYGELMENNFGSLKLETDPVNTLRK